MGVDWSLREGYAWAEDKEHCEEYGRMLQADPNKVSSKAKKRGLPQVAAGAGPSSGSWGGSWSCPGPVLVPPDPSKLMPERCG